MQGIILQSGPCFSLAGHRLTDGHGTALFLPAADLQLIRGAMVELESVLDVLQPDMPLIFRGALLCPEPLCELIQFGLGHPCPVICDGENDLGVLLSCLYQDRTRLLLEAEVLVAIPLDRGSGVDQRELCLQGDELMLDVGELLEVGDQGPCGPHDVLLPVDLGHPLDRVQAVVEKMGGQLELEVLQIGSPLGLLSAPDLFQEVADPPGHLVEALGEPADLLDMIFIDGDVDSPVPDLIDRLCELLQGFPELPGDEVGEVEEEEEVAHQTDVEDPLLKQLFMLGDYNSFPGTL